LFKVSRLDARHLIDQERVMPQRTVRLSDKPGSEAKPKRIRLDAGSAFAPGRSSLLKSFGAWGTSKPTAVEERRSETRHHHVECLAWLGWKTWRGFRTRDAVLINISRGGARIFLDSPPPSGRPVWVFLETPSQNTIVKARVLDLQTTRQGQCEVRVEFSEPCPYAFFEAAVCGLAPANPRMRSARTNRKPAPSRLSAG
jgi:hypothetical protein